MFSIGMILYNMLNLRKHRKPSVHYPETHLLPLTIGSDNVEMCVSNCDYVILTMNINRKWVYLSRCWWCDDPAARTTR